MRFRRQEEGGVRGPSPEVTTGRPRCLGRTRGRDPGTAARALPRGATDVAPRAPAGALQREALGSGGGGGGRGGALTAPAGTAPSPALPGSAEVAGAMCGGREDVGETSTGGRSVVWTFFRRKEGAQRLRRKKYVYFAENKQRGGGAEGFGRVGRLHLTAFVSFLKTSARLSARCPCPLSRGLRWVRPGPAPRFPKRLKLSDFWPGT